MDEEQVGKLKEALHGTFVVYVNWNEPSLTIHRAECRHVGKRGLVSAASNPTGGYLIAFQNPMQAQLAAQRALLLGSGDVQKACSLCRPFRPDGS